MFYSSHSLLCFHLCHSFPPFTFYCSCSHSLSLLQSLTFSDKKSLWTSSVVLYERKKPPECLNVFLTCNFLCYFFPFTLQFSVLCLAGVSNTPLVSVFKSNQSASSPTKEFFRLGAIFWSENSLQSPTGVFCGGNTQRCVGHPKSTRLFL